jgi:membrane fusion protein
MEAGLFRAQALAWQQDGRYGVVMLSRPLTARVLTLLIFTLTLSTMVFLALNSYTRKVSVNGSLVPDTGLVILKAPVAGTVTELEVEAGDFVEAGDRLLVLDQDQMLEGLGSVGDALQQNLDAQRTGILARLDLAQRHGEILARGNIDRKHHLEAALADIGKLQVQEQATLALRHNSLARAFRLHEEEHLATADLDAARLLVIEQQKVLSALDRQGQEISSRLSSQRFESLQQELESRQQLNLLEGEVLRLKEQEVRMLSGHSIEIRAPVSGRIGSMALHEGMSMAGGDQLLSVKPVDSRLVAEFMIPGSAMGFIEKGQSVNLHVEAFPYQKFGVQHGKVLGFDTAATAQPARPGTPLPAELRLVAELDKQSVSAYGSEHELLAGMQLHADILLESRTLFEWLFEPLFGAVR